MKRSIRCSAFRWLTRTKAKVKIVTPVVAYEAGYRACIADLTGCQFKRIRRANRVAGPQQ